MTPSIVDSPLGPGGFFCCCRGSCGNTEVEISNQSFKWDKTTIPALCASFVCVVILFSFSLKRHQWRTFVRNVCETANTGYTKAEHWPPTRVQNLCVLPLCKHSPQLLSRTVLLTDFLLLTGRGLAARPLLTVTTAAFINDPRLLFFCINFNPN